MALQKQIDNSFGLQTGYWKIVEINKNWLERRSHVVLLGWQSKAARDEYPDVLPMDSRQYDWIGSEFPFAVDDNELVTAYDKIKATPEFADAIDV